MSAVDARLDRGTIDRALILFTAKAAVFLGAVLTGFVIIEPAPHEIVLAALMGIWALTGMRIGAATAPLLIAVVLLVCGGMLSMLQMQTLNDAPTYLAVSFFLGMTAVFYATVLQARPDFYGVITAGWIIGALGTGLLGIAGYFGIAPGDMFTVFGRAAGAFKDPNVFGPYLVFPATWLYYRLLTGNPLKMPVIAAALMILLFSIFLSFSRGAWGLTVFSFATLTFALLIRSRSPRFRFRLIAMTVVAIFLIAIAFVIAVQIPAVAELFEIRAQLVQPYDGARTGRFARFIPGFLLAMERPLGIGILRFSSIFGEDQHNIWLKMLLDYSWLGFAAFLSLVVMTLVGGFRILLRERPWQPYLFVAYVCFIGHVLLGTIIDLNHWRHFWLLVGLIWGAMALERRWQSGRIGPDPA